MRWLPGSLATSVRQPAGAAAIDWWNPITRGVAFAWTGASSSTEISKGLTAATNNTVATGVAGGLAARCSAGQTNVEFLAQPLVTSNGAGTGDFTILVFANPTSKATIEHVIAQKNDAAGSPFSQVMISANHGDFGVVSAGSINFFTYSDSSESSVQAAGAITGNFHAWTGRRRGTDHSIWRDSAQLAARARTALNILQSSAERRLAIGSRGNGTTESFAGDVLFAAGWNRALSDDEIRAVSRNPWQLFAPVARPLWAPLVAGVTVYRPGSDIIVNGWTATPGGTLASCIDDPTLDRADYITSPNLTDPATLGWFTALPAGSYDIDVDADRTGASGQIRIVCLDAGGAAVGTSAWQSLTGTATTHTLSVTTSTLSTQFRIEVQ